MGLTFKEDCADVRNSGIENVIKKLQQFKCQIDLYDPWVYKSEIKKIYNIYPKSKIVKKTYDGIIIAVAHKKFKKMGINKILSFCKKDHIIYDLKFIFSKKKTDLRL